MPIDFQGIRIIANPEQAQVRDGSRAHSKKFPFRLSAAPTPEWVALFNREWSMRTVPNRAASVHGDILVIECAIEELPLLAENLEVDMTAANQQYRERLLRQEVKEHQAGRQEQERERADDNVAIREALDQLRKR
ncbi:MAG TPA: hypothetical protein VGP85_13950 [Pyrinomonadaceae bacterium]|jgi:hypothetical protein|nr:hypothetical protein [Pyrinomonadaceae bacterium]